MILFQTVCLFMGFLLNSAILGTTLFYQPGGMMNNFSWPNSTWMVTAFGRKKQDRIARNVGFSETKTNNLIIYPNPNQGDFRIILPESLKDKEKQSIKIYEISGRLVTESQFRSGENQITISLPFRNRGIYYAVFENKKTRNIGKIIVQ